MMVEVKNKKQKKYHKNIKKEKEQTDSTICGGGCLWCALTVGSMQLCQARAAVGQGKKGAAGCQCGARKCASAWLSSSAYCACSLSLSLGSVCSGGRGMTLRILASSSALVPCTVDARLLQHQQPQPGSGLQPGSVESAPARDASAARG